MALMPSRRLHAPESGLLTVFQPVPFQCRITVAAVEHTELPENPTAQASEGDTAATAFSRLPTGPGSGLDTIDQVVPFQCRVIVPGSPHVGHWTPTAHASVGEVALTPPSAPANTGTAGAWPAMRAACAAVLAAATGRQAASVTVTVNRIVFQLTRATARPPVDPRTPTTPLPLSITRARRPLNPRRRKSRSKARCGCCQQGQDDVIDDVVGESVVEPLRGRHPAEDLGL